MLKANTPPSDEKLSFCLPLAYFGNRGKRQANIFKLMQNDVKSRKKRYSCCYDLCAGSGALSFLAISHDIADSYVINDSFAPLARFWQQLKDNPDSLIAEYEVILGNYLAQSDQTRQSFYNELQTKFNAEDFATLRFDQLSHYAATFAFLINHTAYGIPLLSGQGAEQRLDCQLTKQSGKLKIDEDFANAARDIQKLFSGKKIEFRSEDFQVYQAQITQDDIVLLDPPYPNMPDAQQQSQRHIYHRTEPKYELQQKLIHFMGLLEQRGAAFVLHYGVLGLDNDYPITWPTGHILRLSGDPNADATGPFQEFIEHLYLSKSLTQYLPAQQGEIQPLFHRIFEINAMTGIHRNGARPALTWEEKGQTKTLSYAELNKETVRLANYLLQQGLMNNFEHSVSKFTREPLVAICLDRGPAFVISMLAVMKTKAAYLPLDATVKRLQINTLYQRLQGSKPDLLLTTPEIARALSKLDNIKIITIDPNDVLCQGLSTELKEPLTEPRFQVKPDDLACVMYGPDASIGGAELLQGSLSYVFSSLQDLLNLGPKDRVLHFASSELQTSLMEMILALGTGATLYLVDNIQCSDSHALSRFLQNHQITTAILPSKTLVDLDANQFPSLHNLVIVSDHFDKELADKWIIDVESNGFKKLRQVVYGYDLTNIASCMALGLCSKDKPLIIRSHLGLELFLQPLHALANGATTKETVSRELTLIQGLGSANIDNNLATPEEKITKEGVLYVAGSCLVRGYWQESTLTQLHFKEVWVNGQLKRLHRTNNKGYYTPEGNFSITGRIDCEMKISDQPQPVCLDKNQGLIKRGNEKTGANPYSFWLKTGAVAFSVAAVGLALYHKDNIKVFGR